jgi:ubiquinone/menaquinone biosynthesis C-methylase UbiE
VIAGYLRYLKSGGTIFDVGCGEGALFQLMGGTGYSKYIGLDVSSVAIEKLTSQQYEMSQFISADAESYAPTEEIDAIVFGDSLYYFQDPLAAVERYSRVLKQNGMMVVSAYAGSARAMAILRLIKRRYNVFEEVKITRRGQSSTVSVFIKA